MDFGKMSSDRTVWTSGKRRQKCGEQDRAVYSKETKSDWNDSERACRMSWGDE